MIVPPPPVVVQVQPPPRRSARGPIAVLVVLAVLVAAAAGMLVAREMSAPTTVALEPVATAGADPFMPALGTDAVDVRPVAHTGGRRSGTTPGIFGGSGSDAVCDRGQLSRFLADHPDRAAGWAGVLGLADSSSTAVSSYVDGLTSVVLRSDTFVTNHGWAGGHVTSWPAVLQAGTAVLVDRHGNPVTRCFCGNPLSAPRSFSSVAYYGPRWVSFTSNSITVITHQTTTVTNNYTIVDVHTGRGWDRPAGSDGRHDTVNVTITNNFPDQPSGQEQDQQDQKEPSADEASETETTSEDGTVPGAVAPDAAPVERPAPDTRSGSTERAPALAPVAPSSGTTPEPQDASAGSDTSSTPSSSTTTTTTESETPTDPSGDWTASSGCDFGSGTVTFGPGDSYSGIASGTWSRSSSTLTITPSSGGSSTRLGYENGSWTDGTCSLTGGSR